MESLSDRSHPVVDQVPHPMSQVDCSDAYNGREDIAVCGARFASDLRLELLEFHARHRLPYPVRSMPGASICIVGGSHVLVMFMQRVSCIPMVACIPLVHLFGTTPPQAPRPTAA